MRYAVTFTLLSGLLVVHAVWHRGLCWLLLWPALSFAWVALAYAGLGPSLFGKRPDGRMAWWAVLLLLPYLLLTWGIWHLHRLLSKEDAWNEIALGIYLGRRVFVGQLPPDVTLVVDLTAEFPEPRRVVEGRRYICLPTLDAHVPNLAAFRDLISDVADWPGRVYVHCAMGHGRSALLAAAVLLVRGLAGDVREAETLVRKARPRARLRRPQRALLEVVTSTRGAS